MGVLTDIFAGTRDQLPKLDDAEAIPRDLFDTVEAKSIDPVKIAQLQAIVEGITFDAAIGQSELAHAVDEQEGPWVMSFPSTLAERLAMASDEQLTDFGRAWAATEEFRLDGWSESDVHAILREITQLVQRKRPNQEIFVWTCV